jgi:hypothetical protein
MDGTDGFTIGQRVRTTEDPQRYGKIADDFGDLAGTSVTFDEGKTVTSRRWAVQTDDGHLLFLDDDGIEAV